MKKQADEFSDLPEPADQLDDIPSKSQRKRDALRSVDLAKALLEMPSSKRAKFNLATDISDALKLGAEIRSHGAKKRQLHYIGKLLRNSADYELYLRRHENPYLEQSAELASALVPEPETATEDKASPESQDESMRNRLLEDLAGSMNDLRDQYPNANIQLIRQLVSRINQLKQSENEDQAKGKQIKQHGKLINKLSAAIAQGRDG